MMAGISGAPFFCGCTPRPWVRLSFFVVAPCNLPATFTHERNSYPMVSGAVAAFTMPRKPALVLNIRVHVESQL